MIRKATLWVGLLLASAQLSAAPFVRVTTNMGEFTIELNPQRAPLTVENFLSYVREGFYNGTMFHRVVSNFVVQGGGYSATDKQLKKPHVSIPNESGNGLQNIRGTVGLARAEGAHSGNSQFYVNLADNSDLDPVPTRWGYAVFGKVVQGMEVLERIGVMPTGASGPFKGEAPLQLVTIEKVELLSGTVGTATPPASKPAIPVAPTPGEPAQGITPAEPAPAGTAPPPAPAETPPPAQ